MGYVYLLTPAGIADKSGPTAWFLKRKLQEYDASRAEIENLKTEMPEAPTTMLEGISGYD